MSDVKATARELYEVLFGMGIYRAPKIPIIERTLLAYGESALIEFTEKYLTEHPEGYDGPCLCDECKRNA